MSAFRILDLGSHDGFVSWWLATALKERGITRVSIDGVELNSHAVESANKRLNDDGFNAVFIQGAAEDAPEFFMPCSYDAVIAYELIEHVPDVDLFLDRIESMVKPGGRVYISTPDGVFGDGMNPHHLRTYRAIDLFELLRGRGEVDNLITGPDGISVIAYRPVLTRREKVNIFTGGGWQRWHPSDPEVKGLGGSETAAIRLAEAMSDKGFDVTVYGDIDGYAIQQQVIYKNWQTYDPTVDCDIAIMSRSPWAFDRPINARFKCLWMHDTDYGPEVTPDRVEKMDAIFVLSEWHADHVRKMYPFAAEKLVRTSNGIVADNFTQPISEEDRNTHRAIYTSSPDRGLDFLLSIWPRVRERVPDAELAYAYADVYNAVAERNPAIQSFRNRVATLADQEGVVNLGSLTQPAVAVEMQKSGIWLAPSYSSPTEQRFHETFCIGAVESAAAGCYRIMSPWGALMERRDGAFYYVEASAEKPDEDAWVEAICNGMLYPPTQSNVIGVECTWDRTAEDFVEAAQAIAV